MSAIKPEGQLPDQPYFLSMLLQQLIRTVIYSEILIDPLTLDESIISLKINYRMFKILQNLRCRDIIICRAYKQLSVIRSLSLFE